MEQTVPIQQSKFELSRWEQFKRFGLWRSYLGLTGIVLLSIVAIMAIGAPWITTKDPVRHNLLSQLESPSSEFYFGTDTYGRDVFSRTVWGTRASLQVGFMALSVGAIAGITLGLFSGFFGGRVDQVLSRLIDVLISFPSLMVAIVIVGVIGIGTTSVVLALGFALTPRFARLVRGQVLSVRVQDYVEAARAYGASSMRIMFRHVFPNIASPVIVMTTLYLPYAILVEASLSFLGLGVSPDTPTWGRLINDGRQYMALAPWISLFPGIAIMITTIGFNLLGDGLRDALDPQLRSR
jgi:peptide/nickel transport system permease protein